MQRVIAGMAVASASGAAIAEKGVVFGYTINEFAAIVMAGCAVAGFLLSLFMAIRKCRLDKNE